MGPGYSRTSVALSIDPPLALSRADFVTGSTDLYPMVSLAWNSGVNNWMVYGQGDVPVGTYSVTSLANVGIGQGAADFGAGYTYWDHAAGLEFTAVGGFTINAENSSTHYINGIDAHLDWAASDFVSKSWQVGLVGYVYDQISGDSGSGNVVGSFESKVASVGAEVGHLFAVGNRPAYFNVRGCYEFWAENRVKGAAAFVTLSIPVGASPGGATAPSPHE